MAGNAFDMAKVRPLRPPRVVLAVADARFVRIASFLLARRGFEIQATKRPREVLELLERRTADVVILDGTRSFTDAARLAGAVEALHPEMSVIVVADDPQAVEPLHNLQLFPKWTSFDQLASSIERAHVGLAS
jgi:DNA-binding NtrC family response regulator